MQNKLTQQPKAVAIVSENSKKKAQSNATQSNSEKSGLAFPPRETEGKQAYIDSLKNNTNSALQREIWEGERADNNRRETLSFIAYMIVNAYDFVIQMVSLSKQ